MNYLLAFDAGTSGVKASLTDMAGNVIISEKEPLRVYYPRQFYVEQKPEEWWAAVTGCAKCVLDQAGVHPREIAALAFSCMGQSITMVDAQGNALAPAMIWMDNRAGEEAKILMGKLGGSKIFERLLGFKMTGNYALPKFYWAKRRAPDLYRRTRAFLDQGGYLCLRATGEWFCEWTQASCTGLLNLYTKQWDTTTMKLFGLDADRFLPLKKPTERIGCLTAQAAAEMGLMEGTPVFGGTVDAMAAGIGAGAAALGKAFIVLGTSGNLGLSCSKKLKGQSGFATAQSGDPDKLIYIGTNNASGASLSWAANHLYGENGGDSQAFTKIGEDMTRVGVGSDGLLFAPWLAGERSPYPDDSLRGCFINLGINHTREHLIRAIAEGVAHNYTLMADLAEKVTGSPIQVFRMVGGGANYLPWMQIFADVTGRTFEVVRNPGFGGTVGVALLAAVGLGVYPSVEEAVQVVQVEHCLAPDPENHAAYRKSHEAYQEIYPSLKKLYGKLNPTS
ncbi:MAG TPA: FGGY family carbohydrate kinase [Anaerolineaceae bacterium]|nr:FGGY family carbohydrate kinase [Anaerolineaceae bacterium]